MKMNLKPVKKLFMLGAAATTIMAAAEARLEAEAIKSTFCLPYGFTVTAHSGCDGTMPNSIESLKRAINLGADIAEIDITKRADGTLVMLHSGQAPENEGVLLSEALEFVSQNSPTLKLNLDLKRFDCVEEIESLLREYSLTERCFYTGLNFEQAAEVASVTTIPYYININPQPIDRYNEEYWIRTLTQVNMLGAVGVNSQYALISKKAIEYCHMNSLKVSLWTADGDNAINYCLSLQPDNITTRNPQILLKKLRRQ